MTEKETLHDIFSKSIMLKKKLLLAMDKKCSAKATAEVMREYYSLEFRSAKTALCFVESFFENPVY